MAKIHSSLGVSPSEMLLGFRPDIALPIPLPSVSGTVGSVDYVQGLRGLLEDLDSRVVLTLRQQMDKTAAAMAKQRSANREPLQKGDWVLELKPSPHPLVAKVDGPYLVLRLLGRGNVLLSSGATSFKGSQEFTRHITKLAKFYVR
jgi:hypothetical protein